MTDDILTLAQKYLERVKRSGADDIMSVCPFHRKSDGTTERTPSFAMSIRSGLWYCHSCHARGNLHSFLKNVGVPHAEIELRYKPLLDDATRHVPAKTNPLVPLEAVKEPLPESLLARFETCPTMLLEEGFPEDLLRRFDVGFDPIHNRITFPLRNARGQLIGISGRAVDGQHPRYKVYDWEYRDFELPERKTEKRAIVWNLHNVLIEGLFTKQQPDRFVVVVEGFKAVMRVAQAGISNVVGLLGSFLSEEQQGVLCRLGCPILLMLDSNDAGQAGQFDAGVRLNRDVPNLYVVHYNAPQPSDLQPAEIHTALLQAQRFQTWAVNVPLQQLRH